MPEQSHSQQYLAAQSSARNRHTARLLRELRDTRPLTREQREQLIHAAASIPVVPHGQPSKAMREPTDA